MKILQLTTHLDYGGIPTYVASLSKALLLMGHEPLVVSSGGALAKELERSGVLHVELNLRTKSEISPKLPLALFKLLKLVKSLRPDIIHCHTRVTQVVAHFASKCAGLPYISTSHGFFKPRGVRKRFGCWGKRTIAISERVKDHLLFDFKVPEDRIRVIYNGIDLAKFERRPSLEEKEAIKKRFGLLGYKVIGIIARLSSVKGHRYLLEALKRISPRSEGPKLLIVGDGPERERLLKEIKKSGIEEKVLFMKPTLSIGEPLSAMDVFALPTLQEGLGLSLLEAMAQGLPVVASNVGGIKEIIDDGENGILVPPEDPGALADAIDFLLENERRAEVIADNGRASVFERFSLQDMAKKVVEVYKEVCNEEQTNFSC